MRWKLTTGLTTYLVKYYMTTTTYYYLTIESSIHTLMNFEWFNWHLCTAHKNMNKLTPPSQHTNQGAITDFYASLQAISRFISPPRTYSTFPEHFSSSFLLVLSWYPEYMHKSKLNNRHGRKGNNLSEYSWTELNIHYEFEAEKIFPFEFIKIHSHLVLL